jgi:hypothetical protein
MKHLPVPFVDGIVQSRSNTKLLSTVFKELWDKQKSAVLSQCIERGSDLFSALYLNPVPGLEQQTFARRLLEVPQQ